LLRFSKDEIEFFTNLAKKRNLSIGIFIRSVILDEYLKAGKGELSEKEMISFIYNKLHKE